MSRGRRSRYQPTRSDGEMSRGAESSLQGRPEASKESWRDEKGLGSSPQRKLEASEERWRDEEEAEKQIPAYKKRAMGR